jgi:amidophosphoribosyltransferase
VKNRYVGRTFIEPSQKMRAGGVRMKLNPLPENIRGKRLVVVDDSIVRGTTTRQVVAMLREAGAAEVHFRVSSPPYRWPCHYGMDTGRRSELLAADLSVGEIADYLKVDSLAYLELDRLVRSTDTPSQSFCTACLSGDYPVPVPDLVDAKLVLEADANAPTGDVASDVSSGDGRPGHPSPASGEAASGDAPTDVPSVTPRQ